MTIDPETIEAFEPLEIITQCLIEMTAFGYDQESIQASMNELEKGV